MSFLDVRRTLVELVGAGTADPPPRHRVLRCCAAMAVAKLVETLTRSTITIG
jgi:hypothetical protein